VWAYSTYEGELADESADRELGCRLGGVEAETQK